MFIRTCCATASPSHLLQSSGDLRAVQELLGHASIRTTQIYTHLDFQHLAKTYDAATRAHGASPTNPEPRSEGTAAQFSILPSRLKKRS